ncbi:MAG: hypothetical protein ACHQ8D_11130 [Candidatus Rokuibacteriota bacterium]
MKTSHVLILAGAILGAAWMLKPVPVPQISQAELERREKETQELMRFAYSEFEKVEAKRCAAAIGKTPGTLDLNDPQQDAAYRKCRWPEESQSRLRRIWNRMISALIW